MTDARRRKLIEVALPLEAINEACKPETENPFLKGHPRAVHVWWARIPLVACRATVLASLLNDPSSSPEEFPTEESQVAERARLFRLVEKACQWDASAEALQDASDEVRRHANNDPPPVVDPFCGRASIPIEAQRLGLSTYASDLNPVAVLIAHAVVDFPTRFAHHTPVGPTEDQPLALGDVSGISALCTDIEAYGLRLEALARDRLGEHYPAVSDSSGRTGKALAWLWARTAGCPNPACGADMPLVRSFLLSGKTKERVWIEPVIDDAERTVEFKLMSGDGKPPKGSVERSGARCLVCGEAVAFNYLREEGAAGRLDQRLLGVIGTDQAGRIFAAPDQAHESAAEVGPIAAAPEEELPRKALGFRVQAYGMTQHKDLYTRRQLLLMTTLCELIDEIRQSAHRDAVSAGVPNGEPLAAGGNGALAYAEAIATYLSCAVGRWADYSSTLATWNPTNRNVSHVFQRHALPMTWDFAEANPFGDALSLSGAARWVAGALRNLPPSGEQGVVRQLDAAAAVNGVEQPMICTDPPYYANIGYADLSDYFYVWLRRCVGGTFPDLFSTVLTPKKPELIATPFRHEEDKARAKDHFETGMREAFTNMRAVHNPEYPMTVFYAYKQAEEENEGTASTGWETMLTSLIDSQLVITGTWPMRTTKAARAVARNTNALASAVVLVCRPREEDAPLATRKEFAAQLRSELPSALRNLQQGAIAPVDLAQASIGPGMAVYSRYSRVIEADGQPMRVRTALELINEALDELLAEQEADFDPDTRWCVAWFEQYGTGEGPFGEAETLSRAKNTSIDGLIEAGVIESAAGKVALLGRDALGSDWDPSSDARLTVWEVTQHLIRNLQTGGEPAAADLLRQVGGLGEPARELAYRLFQLCARKDWAGEAIGYNSLATAWLEISRLAAAGGERSSEPLQEDLGI